MQADQSSLKEVKYAQYLVYAFLIIYLVRAIIPLVMNARGFYIPFELVVFCALGYYIAQALGRLHSGTRTFVIVMASLSLLIIVGFFLQHWFGLLSLIFGNTPAQVYDYVTAVLYAVIDVLLLYYLTRPRVREAFRNVSANPPQEVDSGQ